MGEPGGTVSGRQAPAGAIPRHDTARHQPPPAAGPSPQREALDEPTQQTCRYAAPPRPAHRNPPSSRPIVIHQRPQDHSKGRSAPCNNLRCFTQTRVTHGKWPQVTRSSKFVALRTSSCGTTSGATGRGAHSANSPRAARGCLWLPPWRCRPPGRGSLVSLEEDTRSGQCRRGNESHLVALIAIPLDVLGTVKAWTRREQQGRIFCRPE